MKIHHAKQLLATTMLCALAVTAQAHIVIDNPVATTGAYQKLTFKVGHGCDGSATTSIKITVPDGVLGAKPQPKTGWTINTVTSPLKVPVTSHGKTITSDVSEITWSGGNLPDAYYDEFSIHVKLPTTAGKLYFKVNQLCEKGRNDWVEIPTDDGKKLKSPAAVLDVQAKKNEEHQH
jgi:periplasmic copper chaperone A